jgi:hypothetical protein
MVGMAPINRERVRFDNYSTSTCGLRRKNLTEQAVLRKHLMSNWDGGGVFSNGDGAGSENMG